MTSEVIVMNRIGVAMAADSAVTLADSKVLNSANKLYMLAPGYPVGVLVFNSASLVQTPWEIVIKLYRDNLTERKVRFGTLGEYASDFIYFIQSSGSDLVSEEEQHQFFRHLLSSIFDNEIVEVIKDFVYEESVEKGAKVPQERINELFAKIVEGYIRACGNSPDFPDELDVEGFYEVLHRELTYREIFDDEFNKRFSAFDFDDKLPTQLWEAVLSVLTKDVPYSGSSGIVFAGYGDKDIYPSFVQCHFDFLVGNTIKCKRMGSASARTQRGVFPFGQDDIVHTLLGGIHPIAYQLIADLFQRYFLEGLNNIHVIDENDDRYHEIINTASNKRDQFQQTLKSAMLQQYTMRIINIVESLSKDELALMAETLISTTSYMRRVSANVETVGGPTDIAIISKKDGFIWVKRKHYFEPEFNYHFFGR